MAYINDPAGRLCDWGIPRIECWGARLPADYRGELPPQMQLLEIPEAEYIVFEHGPFDYEQENRSVEAKIEDAMRGFDYSSTEYCLDISPGRIMIFSIIRNSILNMSDLCVERRRASKIKRAISLRSML